MSTSTNDVLFSSTRSSRVAPSELPSCHCIKSLSSAFSNTGLEVESSGALVDDVVTLVVVVTGVGVTDEDLR